LTSDASIARPLLNRAPGRRKNVHDFWSGDPSQRTAMLGFTSRVVVS
jgi:hypothetical protein